MEKGDLSEEAMTLYIYSLDQMKKANLESHLLTATLYNNIALCYIKQNKEKKLSLENLIKSVAIRENLSDSSDLELANSYHNLGLVYKEEEQFENAIININKALNIREINFGNSDRELLNELRILAQIYEEAKDFDMQNKMLDRIKNIEENE